MTEHNGKGPASERDDIETLLPWYATGKLGAAERARVDRYLAAHPDAATQLAGLRDELDAFVIDNEAESGPAGGALARLMESAGAEPRRWPGWFEASAGAVGRWIEMLSPGQLGLAAMAAALVVVLQAAAIGGLLLDRPDGVTYETASGPRDAAPATGTFALVSFVPGASATAITDLLLASGAAIADGPKPGGLYRVRLSTEPLDEAAARARLATLGARRDIVAFVALTR